MGVIEPTPIDLLRRTKLPGASMFCIGAWSVFYMTGTDKERLLYDGFLDALTEHTRAVSELRASELRLLQNQDDSASAMAKRVVLKKVEQMALRRCLKARKVYEDYRLASTESNQKAQTGASTMAAMARLKQCVICDNPTDQDCLWCNKPLHRLRDRNEITGVRQPTLCRRRHESSCDPGPEAANGG